jgi:hypothetical protein
MGKEMIVATVLFLVLALLLPSGVRGESYSCSSETDAHVVAIDMDIEDSLVRHLSIETDTKPGYTDCLILVINGDNTFSQEASSGAVILTSGEQPCTIAINPFLDGYDITIDRRCKSYHCSRSAYMPARVRVYKEARPCIENPSSSP